MPAAIGLAESRRSVPPNGATRMPDSAGVDKVQRDQAGAHGHLGPVADAAEVARVPQRHNGHAVAARLVDSELHRGFAHHLAEAELAVDHRDRVILEDGLERLIGEDLARAQPVDVAGHANDSVRVVPDQIAPTR